MLSKTTSVYEVFMHHFEKMSLASGAFPPDLHREAASGPCSDTLIAQCPPLKKNPAGAHDRRRTYVPHSSAEQSQAAFTIMK